MTATVAEPKTWSISSGTLPPGLAIDAATGLISGTPTAAGQFDFQVLAKMNTDTRSDTKALGIVVREQLGSSEPSRSRPHAARSAEVSLPFDAMLAATGGTGTYVWSLTSGALPPGLTLDGRRDLGDAHDRRRLTASPRLSPTRKAALRTIPRRIVIAEKLAVSTLLLRPAQGGQVYYQAKVKTARRRPAATWRIVRGPLPRGVRFDRTAGSCSSGSRRARAAFA